MEQEKCYSEFEPESSGIGLIAVKSGPNKEEVENIIEELFSREKTIAQKDCLISSLCGDLVEDEISDDYINMAEEGEILFKYQGENSLAKEFFWKVQYERHSQKHFYQDLLESVENSYSAYFVYFPGIAQNEVNFLFRLLKGRTKYFTENKEGYKYNSVGYGIRGLYPQKSTVIDHVLFENVFGYTNSEDLIFYYKLSIEEQEKIYPFLTKAERYRALSNTVHAPDNLSLIEPCINYLYSLRNSIKADEHSNVLQKLLQLSS